MPNNRKSHHLRIFIIAGEVSGDVLGARIMRAIGDAEFIGIGGQNMCKAGLSSIFPMSDLSVMGVAEVAANARTLTRRIRETVDAIINSAPDIVLTIDSPGFARSVISRLRRTPRGKELIKNGLRFHHVVAPQVWAWRPGRAKKYAKTFDKLYAFFDFEVPYFTRYGLDTVAVGHPIADAIIGKYDHIDQEHGPRTITLIPGSRMSEVKRLMPILRDTVDMLARCGFSNYKYVIPTVETTTEYIKSHVEKWPVRPTLISSDARYDMYQKTYIAIAASGTVSAELAMMHVPAIIIYRMNPLTIWLARRLIRIKWVSLVNIILNRGVYPELLGGDARPQNIFDAICTLVSPGVRSRMISQLRTADDMWRRGAGGAAELIAKSVLDAAAHRN